MSVTIHFYHQKACNEGFLKLGNLYSKPEQVLSDRNRSILRRCEVMIKILCKASLLKDDDCRLKGQPFGSRMCIRCVLCALETATHMIMQCPANAHHRQSMHDEIRVIHPGIYPQEYLNVVMGKCIVEWEYDNVVPIWEISAKWFQNGTRLGLDSNFSNLSSIVLHDIDAASVLAIFNCKGNGASE